MTIESINNYSQQLASKKDELIRQLQNQVAGIDIPTDNPTNVPTPIERTNHIPPYITVAGATLLLVGLCSKSAICSILGGLTVGTGAFMWYRDKISQPTSLQQKPNFTVLASKVNDALRNIHTSIASDWDSFVSKQVSEIKSHSVTYQLSEEQRNKINDLLMTHSIISFSIMDLFPKLMSTARSGNVSEFNSIVNSFKDDYITAIESACLEQINTFNQIASILK